MHQHTHHDIALYLRKRKADADEERRLNIGFLIFLAWAAAMFVIIL